MWESDKTTWKHNEQESQEVSPFLAGNHVAARNRQDSITKTNITHQLQKRIHNRSTALVWSVKNTGGLNMFNGTNLTLNSDVYQDT